jgi:hypothetical protein
VEALTIYLRLAADEGADRHQDVIDHTLIDVITGLRNLGRTEQEIETYIRSLLSSVNTKD